MSNCFERIKIFNEGRIPDMLRVKYKLMRGDVFRFFRGTNHLFYEDLALNNPLPPSPLCWLCGDMHLENFGSFKGDNRLVYFDINDFDDALLGPAAFDVARLVCSIFIAFDSLKIDDNKANNMGQLFLKVYSEVLEKGKAYYIEPQTAKGIVRKFLTTVSKRKEKRILRKRTILKKDSLTILLEHPRHFELKDSLRKELTSYLNHWLQYNSYTPYNYQVQDVAFRMAGTGSLGLDRYLFLLRSTNQPNKHMLMEMKQSVEPAPKKHIKMQQPQWESEAERVVNIQQRMQNIPPALLSFSRFRDKSYLIQEMQPTKDSFDFKLVRDAYRDLYQVIHDMAVLTASAQIRSSGWKGASVVDDLSSFGANKMWQEAVLDFGRNYSQVVKKDYLEFCGQSVKDERQKTKKTI
ncbi:MAG: DUF2252 domain-containing protein [Bacteroidota bacterium]|nr:DUF2252 domain-containing protein [Bacteroidota bacterium]